MVLRNAVAYTLTSLLSQTANFVSAFVLRRLLPPELMGVWNMALVVRGYLQATSIGVLNGAFMELPILSGQRDKDQETRYRSVAFNYAMCESVLVGVGLWAFVAWRSSGFTALECYALLATGLVAVSVRAQEAYTVFFWSGQHFAALSQLLLVTGLVYACALPLGALWGGVPGLLLASIAAESFRGVCLVTRGCHIGMTCHWLWDGRILKRLVGYGLAYRITDYPLAVSMTLDLLWVTSFFGLKALGVYALAKTFYAGVSDVAARVSAVLYTRTLARYGQGVDRGTIAGEMRRFLQFQLLVLVPLLSAMAAAIAPFFIRQIIPLYSEGIPVILVLVIGSFFVAQNNNLFAPWIAEKRLIAYGVSNSVGLIAVAGSLTLTTFGLGRRRLVDVATATVIGYALYFGFMVFTSGRELWGTRRASFVLLQVSLAVVWTGVLLVVLPDTSPQAIDWRQDLLNMAWTAIEMFAGLSPLVAFGLWLSDGGGYLYRAVIASLMKVPRG